MKGMAVNYLSFCAKVSANFRELESFKLYIDVAHKIASSRREGYNDFVKKLDKVRKNVVGSDDSIAIKTAALEVEKIVVAYVNKETRNANFYIHKCLKGEKSWCRVENRYLICGKDIKICDKCEHLNKKNSKIVVHCEECTSVFKAAVLTVEKKEAKNIPLLCPKCVMRHSFNKRMYVVNRKCCPVCGVPILPTSSHCPKCTPYKFVINLTGKKR